MAGELHTIDAVILAGGLGTRIRAVLGETPKVLAPVAGRPFLQHLLDWLESSGVRRCVLCLGHLADRVTSYLAAHPHDAMQISSVIEPEPLGTAGALRFAGAALRSDPVLVINGDTFCEVDLQRFLAAHLIGGHAATLLCARVESAARFGTVELQRPAEDGQTARVAAFAEKSETAQGPGLINAGLYLLGREPLRRLGELPDASLEREFFPRLLAEGALGGYVTGGEFIDIGVPESLAGAGPIIGRITRTGLPGRGQASVRNTSETL